MQYPADKNSAQKCLFNFVHYAEFLKCSFLPAADYDIIV